MALHELIATQSIADAGASVFRTIAALPPWRFPLLAATSVGIAAGWHTWWRKRRVACDPEAVCATHLRSLTSLGLLLLASLIVPMAIGWDYLEPSLLKLVYSP